MDGHPRAVRCQSAGAFPHRFSAVVHRTLVGKVEGRAETRAHGPWVTDTQPVDSHVDSGRTVETSRRVHGEEQRVSEETVDLDGLWSHAIDGLTDSTVTPQQRAWLRTTRPLGLLDDTALLAAPNEFTKDVLETRLRPMITDALSGCSAARSGWRSRSSRRPGRGGRDRRCRAGRGRQRRRPVGPDQVAEETMPGMHWPPPSA